MHFPTTARFLFSVIIPTVVHKIAVWYGIAAPPKSEHLKVFHLSHQWIIQVQPGQERIHMIRDDEYLFGISKRSYTMDGRARLKFEISNRGHISGSTRSN
jgi:hypothetical protein